MYATTNRCYNERGSRTNYVRSSIPHFISQTTPLEKLPTRNTNTVSIMEQKDSFPYSQKPAIRPYIEPYESRLYKMHFNYVNNQQDALYRLIYYSKSALHAWGDVFAHHHEHLTVYTVSGSVDPSCCRLPAGSNLGQHYQIL